MRKLGFTVIEVSIAIAILSILLAIGTLGLQNYLAGARDHERKNDLQNIATHLENYYRNNGQYPSIKDFEETDGTTKDPREVLTELAIDDITAPGKNDISFKADDSNESDINTYKYTPTCSDEEENIVCRSFVLSVNLENGSESFKIESKR